MTSPSLVLMCICCDGASEAGEVAKYFKSSVDGDLIKATSLPKQLDLLAPKVEIATGNCINVMIR